MKKKLNDFLLKLRRSKFFKIFFSSFLIFGVLISCFVVPSSAVGNVIDSGMYSIDLALDSITPQTISEVSLNFPFRSAGIDFTGMRLVCDSYGWFQVFYLNDSYPTSDPRHEVYVYDSANGFDTNPSPVAKPLIMYGLIWIDQDVSALLPFASMFNSIFFELNAIDRQYYDIAFEYGSVSGFDSGYDEGFQDGFLVSSENTYDQGFQDGVNSVQSGNLGQNLIGDTLSGPFRALDQFIIFESPNGSDISLGYIVGGFIALTLFIAFLKFFAGG